jgi:hypothetical protein
VARALSAQLGGVLAAEVTVVETGWAELQTVLVKGVEDGEVRGFQGESNRGHSIGHIVLVAAPLEEIYASHLLIEQVFQFREGIGAPRQ